MLILKLVSYASNGPVAFFVVSDLEGVYWLVKHDDNKRESEIWITRPSCKTAYV